MFAVVEIGGSQYKVAEGDKLEVDKLQAKEGETLKLDKVLLIDSKIGTPYLEGAVVEAKVLGATRGDKIRVFKMSAKKRTRKVTGSRSYLTEIEIVKIKG
ncbi:MAG: 50S ribosomal protein L21 [Candidatus Gracilibacteria bacterium]|nr:50S ribosomal protein L21 [Candidatus Gracilibacteria bacterium]